MMPKIFLVVVDGLGVAPDGGDTSTLRSVCEQVGYDVTALGVLCKLGLECAVAESGHLMRQVSLPVGSEEGHREMFGFVTTTPHPIASEPLPSEVIITLEKRFGVRFIGNEQGRGKEIVPKYWHQHINTGSIIVYRGFDSVVVISAEESISSPNRLYGIGLELRSLLNDLPHLCVKKVIAKPLRNGISVEELRRDYFQQIDGDALIHEVVPMSWRTVTNRKVYNVLTFNADEILETHNDEDCLRFLTLEKQKGPRDTFMMINLEDFDRYAHMGNAFECWQTLRKLDSFLCSFIELFDYEDCLIVTGDHGVRIGEGDLGSAHSREAVPLLCFYKSEVLKGIHCHRGYSVVGKAVAEIVKNGYPRSLLTGVC